MALSDRSSLPDSHPTGNASAALSGDSLQSDRQEGGQLYNSIMACDDLFEFPSIFQKTKCHEPALLQAFCQRYRVLVHANSLFEEDNKLFGAVFKGTRKDIVALARVIDSDGVWNMRHGGKLVSRAESLVQSPVPRKE